MVDVWYTSLSQYPPVLIQGLDYGVAKVCNILIIKTILELLRAYGHSFPLLRCEGCVLRYGGCALIGVFVNDAYGL